MRGKILLYGSKKTKDMYEVTSKVICFIVKSSQRFWSLGDKSVLLLPSLSISSMNTQEIIHKLEAKGIKPTANRILVLKTLEGEENPLSLKDLEQKMVSMDKSSIFRTLTLFLEHDVVHSFEDGRGVLNYEVCEEEGECDHHDGHIHFYCESCHRSFCMEDIHIPSFSLPEGFFPHSVSFVIKGICPDCS